MAVCKQEASHGVVLEDYEELTSTWIFLTSGESECTVGVANSNTEQPLINWSSSFCCFYKVTVLRSLLRF